MSISDDNLKLSSIFEKGPTPSSFYGVSTDLLPILERFSVENMKSSSLLDVCWKEILYSLHSGDSIYNDQSENLSDPSVFKQAFESIEEGLLDMDIDELPLNLSQVISYLILPSLNNAYQIMVKLSKGNISIGESLKYTEFCKAEELHQLNSFFEANVPVDAIKMSFERLECASNMKKCDQQSDAILQTAKVLNLGGDFLSIQKIKNKVKITV